VKNEGCAFESSQMKNKTVFQLSVMHLRDVYDNMVNRKQPLPFFHQRFGADCVNATTPVNSYSMLMEDAQRLF